MTQDETGEPDPLASEQTPVRWKRIYEARNSQEAALLRGLLEDELISVQVAGDRLDVARGYLPITETSVDVLVPEEDVAAARKLVEAYDSGELAQRPMTSEEWVCGNCGETNEGNFEICWNCQEPRPEE